MPANSVNTAFQGVLSNDKSVIHLPRQYLQITNGGIYFKGYGEKKGNGGFVPYCFLCNEQGGNR